MEDTIKVNISNKEDSYGIIAIIQERADQVNKYNYTAEYHANNPKLYNDNQLVYAAQILMFDLHYFMPCPNYWDKDWWRKLQLKPKEEKLAIAGAFIACEIDRLSYIEKQTNE